MKKKVLLGYNYILHYRVPLFNLLSEKYDLTVLHSGDRMLGPNDKYKEMIFKVKKLGPFFIQKGILSEVTKEKYDYIILLFDLRWINTIISIYLRNKKTKLILWGAWMTNSSLANKARIFLSKKADASLFYTQQARTDFINSGIDSKKTFVANNTFDVGERVKAFENEIKDQILFVGKLDKRKEVEILIKGYANIVNKIPNHIQLTIIGDGSEFEKLKTLVKKENIENRVIFAGKIIDTKKLRTYYKKAIVSVSFGQAGLSVLQSLGYGVPFLTKKNAISGGEITNVKHRINGILCSDNVLSLEKALIELCNNKEFANNLGRNAYYYYDKYCTIENMNQGFLDAIENTNFAKVDDLN